MRNPAEFRKNYSFLVPFKKTEAVHMIHCHFESKHKNKAYYQYAAC